MVRFALEFLSEPPQVTMRVNMSIIVAREFYIEY